MSFKLVFVHYRSNYTQLNYSSFVNLFGQHFESQQEFVVFNFTTSFALCTSSFCYMTHNHDVNCCVVCLLVFIESLTLCQDPNSMSRVFNIFKNIFVIYNFFTETDDDLQRSKSIFHNDIVGFKFLTCISKLN